jgi:1-acyl-sn-glycerol-3-phosphate acyltransferase
MAASHSLWRWFFYGLKPFHRLLVYGYFQITIEGKEFLGEKPAILAPTHLSRWDPLLVALLSPDPLWFVATQSEFKGLQGWVMKRLGTIPIHRDRTKASSFHRMEALLRQGETLVIFPEGGIRREGLGELKPGLGRLVMRMQRKYHCSIPVLPVTISYKPRVCFRAQVTLKVLPSLIQNNNGSDKKAAESLTQALTQVFQESC